MSITRRVLAVRALLTLAAGLIVAACDDPIEPESGPTLIRFFNATPDASGPLRFALTGGVSAQLNRGQLSSYVAADPGVYAVTIRDDSDHWIIADDLQVVSGLHQTLIAFGQASSASGVLVGDEPGLPPGGRFMLRFLHLAPGITGQVEVHILQGGEQPSDGSVALTQLTYPSSRGYAPVDEGSWRVVITGTNHSGILVDSGVLSFAAGEAFTVILMNAPNGTPELVRLRDGA